MDKETLSNYGWVVCVILVLAIMISLATPFGSVIRNKVAGTVENFKSNSEEVLDNVGGATSFDDLGGGGSGGAGGGEPAHACTDGNADYHCDECNAIIPHTCVLCDIGKENFEDTGSYGGHYYCELCGETLDHTCEYTSGPYCDTCGELDPDHGCNGNIEYFNDGTGHCWACGNLIPHECVVCDEGQEYFESNGYYGGYYTCSLCGEVIEHTCEFNYSDNCDYCGELNPDHFCSENTCDFSTGVCYYCGKYNPEYLDHECDFSSSPDEDSDGHCDICNEIVSHNCYEFDDGSGSCSVCGATAHPCEDNDSDGYCDYYGCQLY